MSAFHPVERAPASVVAIDVDEDSFLLSVRIMEMLGQSRSEPFDQWLNASLGIRRHDHVLTVGDLLLVVGVDDRLRSLEWRMGPATLWPGPVATPNGRGVALRVEAAWDENGRADLPGQSVGIFDLSSRMLRIELGQEPADWCFVADGCAVGLSGEGDLAQVFLRDCPVDLCALVGVR